MEDHRLVTVLLLLNDFTDLQEGSLSCFGMTHVASICATA